MNPEIAKKYSAWKKYESWISFLSTIMLEFIAWDKIDDTLLEILVQENWGFSRFSGEFKSFHDFWELSWFWGAFVVFKSFQGAFMSFHVFRNFRSLQELSRSFLGVPEPFKSFHSFEELLWFPGAFKKYQELLWVL